MKSKAIAELKESIRQAGWVRRGEQPPHRVWRFTKQPDGSVKREQINPLQFQRDQATKWNSAPEGESSFDQ